MKSLTEDIIQFFKKQGFVIVATVDKNGGLHASCKGIVKMDKAGFVYLLDLYRNRTYANLKENPHISITAVDEHKFEGYCLKGRVKKITEEALDVSLLEAWEEKLTNRITRRLIRNIHGDKGHQQHPESILPKPEYLILVEVEEVVELAPSHMNKD